jgi:hypothetical protein
MKIEVWMEMRCFFFDVFLLKKTKGYPESVRARRKDI